MKPADLLAYWQKTATGEVTTATFNVRLPLEEAAKVRALQEMYPKRTEEQLIGELLSAALFELEESMPYVAGSKVISHDEEGDPLYEDTGPTRQFLALAQTHLARIKEENAQ